jgi:maleate isomerase
VAPYVKPLTCLVAEYLEAEGFTVVDKISLEIADNVAVGRRDPLALVQIYKELNLDGVDALVLSSCVQMPSLAAIPVVEQECGLPVVSAAVCTTYQMLDALGLPTNVPHAGALLSGAYSKSPMPVSS